MLFDELGCEISIHAPTRGATKLIDELTNPKLVFQSTLPRGERHLQMPALLEATPISIHAPTRGATSESGRNPLLSANFNPRSHEGSDHNHKWFPKHKHGFQSTLPRGERLMQMRILVSKGAISIHAPTRGATLTALEIYLFTSFQSTLPRGERQNKLGLLVEFLKISIHAPTRGATIRTQNYFSFF